MAAQHTKHEPIKFPIPDLTIKDLLSAIPKHCFERSALHSMSYIIMDVILLALIYHATVTVEQYISPVHVALPHPLLYDLAWYSLWALYGFASGLVATGLWVIAHECGHQAFFREKMDQQLGWLGFAFRPWSALPFMAYLARKTSRRDRTLDSRSGLCPRDTLTARLPKFDPEQEDILGTTVSQKMQQELREAIGDTPIVSAIRAAGYLLIGWPMYLIRNSSGQKYYKNCNHFVPNPPLYAPHQTNQIYISDLGIFLWLAGMGTFGYLHGLPVLFRVYLVPYLWVNHWLVLITFLQHTDPLLPHYRGPEFTFPRGALSTLDRHLLGDLGPIGAWLGATLTHGISETHVLHHVSSKIPHYNAWEASRALHKLLAGRGLHLQGAPGGWSEMYRCFRECRFVEDEGNVVFYKNERGLAACVPVLPESSVSDSGVDVQ